MAIIRRVGAIMLATIVAGALCGRAGGAEEGKRPVPDAGAQARIEKTVRELFRADFAKHAAADRLVLVTKLLKAADETSSDPDSQYVLLRDARDAAIAGGNIDAALRAIDEMTAHFDLDGAALRLEALTTLSRQPLNPEGAAAVVSAALSAVDAAAAADDFDAATRLAGIAETAAPRVHEAALTARVQARVRSLKEGRAAAERLRAARRTLADNPDDPEANLAVGWYQWLQKGDADGAMPFLAKGSDKELKNLVAGDLLVKGGRTDAGGGATAVDADGLLARGEAWSRYATTQNGPARVAAGRRAAGWFTQASGAATGLGKLVAERRAHHAEADAAGYAAQHSVGAASADRTPAPVRRRQIDAAATTPLPAQTYSGDKRIEPSFRPYRLDGTIDASGSTHITFDAGAEVRGGTFNLNRDGHIIAKGSKDKPVIFRHVTFQADLGGSLEAEDAVFDDCQFKKNGGWFASYSTKWQFTSCILYASHFAALTEVDYGFQMHNCILASMDLPEIKHNHGDNFSHVNALHGDWNKIVACDFVDCLVPPTVFWCAEESNFRGCKFAPGEAFDSDAPWDDNAYVIGTVGPAPQSVWATNHPAHAAVRLVPAPAPFPTLAPTAAALAIPELRIDDLSGITVTHSHFTQTRAAGH